MRNSEILPITIDYCSQQGVTAVQLIPAPVVITPLSIVIGTLPTLSQDCTPHLFIVCSTKLGRFLMCWQGSAARDYNADSGTPYLNSFIQVNSFNYFLSVGTLYLQDNKSPTSVYL